MLSKVLCIDEAQLAGKLVWFSSDSANTMMAGNSGVVVQLGGRYAPFMESIHCCAHRLAKRPHSWSKRPILGSLRQS